MTFTYPRDTTTPFLGLSLIGMDDVIAEDMILIDKEFANLPPAIPGGTNGQIQFNNAGVFGGVTNVPIGDGH